jgi:hypothetical protein
MALPLRALLALIALAATAAAWRRPNDKRPNFVFFYPDTISAEALGTYGHPLSRTPNTDRCVVWLMSTACP